MNLFHARLFVIYAFAFLGPLGNLLTPCFFPQQFRTFYFVLLGFPFYFTRLRLKELRSLFLFFPFLAYCLISAYFCLNQPYEHLETSMFERCLLFTTEFFFMFGAVFYLRRYPLEKQKGSLIRFYIFGYFLSLLFGYFLFIGFYLNFLSFEIIERFTTLPQFGFGLLRFSPGTYANEYGNVSSFVCCTLALLIAEKKTNSSSIGITKKWLIPLLFFSLIALLLTTTRAAYLSFCMGMLYLFLVSKRFRLFFLSISLSLLALCTAISACFNVFWRMVTNGLQILFTTFKTVHLRFNHWSDGLRKFQNHPFFGEGYGSYSDAHNVFLELLFELGVIGCFLLIGACLIYGIMHRQSIKTVFLKKRMDSSWLITSRITVLGLIHVFLFAASNHNLNHHLTWMIFLLFNMNLFAQKKSDTLLLITT